MDEHMHAGLAGDIPAILDTLATTPRSTRIPDLRLDLT
jgi:hypothetical protein